MSTLKLKVVIEYAPYQLYGMINNVPYNLNVPSLSQTKNPTNCLAFHRRIPLRLNNMNVVGNDEIVKSGKYYKNVNTGDLLGNLTPLRQCLMSSKEQKRGCRSQIPIASASFC